MRTTETLIEFAQPLLPWRLIMSTAAQPTDNASHETPVELVELTRAIEALPAAERLSLQPALQRVLESTSRRRKILQLVQEALGQLRLDMKYLVFDLEATRRERDNYQEMVRKMNGESDDSSFE
jgi:hypothetical protein